MEVRNKKDVIDEAKKEVKTEHVASLMDICHLENSELEPKHQKYKGRMVLPGDIVKDDSGSYAACTEKGSSASQMTAAKVSWTLYQGFQDVQDRQLTQCPLTPRSKWRMLPNY